MSNTEESGLGLVEDLKLVESLRKRGDFDEIFDRQRRSLLDELAKTHSQGLIFYFLSWPDILLTLLAGIVIYAAIGRHFFPVGAGLAISIGSVFLLWIVLMSFTGRKYKRRARATLQQRLSELERLKAENLVNEDEYEAIRAKLGS